MPAKRADVIKLVQDFQARKLRIDGVGNQAHCASIRRASTRSRRHWRICMPPD
jgi:GH35 family endo-1,4-beta-xylanase